MSVSRRERVAGAVIVVVTGGALYRAQDPLTAFADVRARLVGWGAEVSVRRAT